MRRSVREIADAAGSYAAQIRDRIRAQLDERYDAAAMFYDGETMKPAAVRFFQRLAQRNYVDRSAWADSPDERARREGRRELALELLALGRLDPARLKALNEQLLEE